MSFSDEIIKVLDDLARRMGVAIDWASENAVPYVMELCGKLVKYELYTSMAMFFASILALGVLCFVTYKAAKIECSYLDIIFDDMILFTTWVVFGVAILAVWFTQVPDIIACLTFPEMIVVRYLSVM